mmetsp:Transcript_56405/g.123338  ORF Transcript_56405/g.123338 Transcript_56405/m.123338 type:complete len:356 (-) Transcript_56405:191-1258(-)
MRDERVPIHSRSSLRRSTCDLQENGLSCLLGISMSLGQQRPNVLERQEPISVLVSSLKDHLDAWLNRWASQVDAGRHKFRPIDSIFVLAQVHSCSGTFGLLLVIATTYKLSHQDGLLQHASPFVVKLLEDTLKRWHFIWRPLLSDLEANQLVECIALAGRDQAVHQAQAFLHLSDWDGIGSPLHKGFPQSLSRRDAAGAILLQHLQHHRGRIGGRMLDPFEARSRLGIPEVSGFLFATTILKVPGHVKAKQFKQNAAAAEDIGLRGDLATPDFRRHGGRRPHGIATLEIPWLEDGRHAQVNDHDMRDLPEDIVGANLLVAALQELCLGGQRRHQHDVLRLDVQVNYAIGMDVSDC